MGHPTPSHTDPVQTGICRYKALVHVGMFGYVSVRPRGHVFIHPYVGMAYGLYVAIWIYLHVCGPMGYGYMTMAVYNVTWVCGKDASGITACAYLRASVTGCPPACLSVLLYACMSSCLFVCLPVRLPACRSCYYLCLERGVSLIPKAPSSSQGLSLTFQLPV